MKTLVDKRVRMNLAPFKRSPFMLEAFSMAAGEQGWTKTEIELAVNQTNGCSLDEKYSILQQYTLTYGDDMIYVQEDVQFMLNFLGCNTHYLNEKPVATWDNYDKSNFNSLKRKATRSIKAVFAHFSESVEECDKYKVTTPQSEYFDTMEEALEAVPVGQESNINIYALWISS